MLSLNGRYLFDLYFFGSNMLFYTSLIKNPILFKWTYETSMIVINVYFMILSQMYATNSRGFPLEFLYKCSFILFDF